MPWALTKQNRGQRALQEPCCMQFVQHTSVHLTFRTGFLPWVMATQAMLIENCLVGQFCHRYKGQTCMNQCLEAGAPKQRC
eukprot:1027204-Pelagomonas_calceolata.AAC.5